MDGVALARLIHSWVSWCVRGHAGALLNFRLECFNFQLQCVVLGHLALQKAAGQCHLFCNALGGEQINVLELVLAFLKIAHLHKALVHEGLEAIVEPANAHAQLVCQLALGQVWIVLQDAHDLEMRVFLNGCHWALPY